MIYLYDRYNKIKFSACVLQRARSNVKANAHAVTRFADRYHGPGVGNTQRAPLFCQAGVVTPIAGLPKPRSPVNLDEALRTASDGVAGVSPAQFRR
jgi:hypothetical protein